jgi:uncharacterized protein with NRDE domain
MNDAGLFAALTNRPTQRPDPSRRSRGLLVSDALAAPGAALAASGLAGLPAGAYNPFNLLVCDREEAFVVVYEEKPDVRRLAAGAHVIGNGDPDSRRLPKLARLLDEAESIARGRPEEALDGLGRICRTHRGGASPFEDTCIHAGPYGTRSSALIRWGKRGGADAFRFANGPPCQSAYEDFTPLLTQLDETGLQTGAATRNHA